jgi:hypothetical protein
MRRQWGGDGDHVYEINTGRGDGEVMDDENLRSVP